MCDSYANPNCSCSEIIALEANVPIATKVLTYADAQTKWQDICIAVHRHDEAVETPPASPTKRGPASVATPKRGPTLDASFFSTPATPSSIPKNTFLPTPAPPSSPTKNTFFSTPGTPSSKGQYRQGVDFYPQSPSPLKSASSTSTCAPYFLYSSGQFRTVFSSA